MMTATVIIPTLTPTAIGTTLDSLSSSPLLSGPYSGTIDFNKQVALNTWFCSGLLNW